MPNRLIHESSPYLQQHAHNPVDWYPWGKEALEKAVKEDKPILVSIGYSACHWCHVMEHESFEDAATAAVMNEHFINIKIDREERPDLDHIYMDAVQTMTGSGGWPLNVFLTPDKKPFYGGTYFPPVAMANRASWTDVLLGVSHAFTEKREAMEQQANGLLDHIQTANNFGINTAAATFKEEDIHAACMNLLGNADVQWGGFGSAPKFPQTFSIQFLLRYYYLHKNNEEAAAEKALQQGLLSLDKMIAGGIYDQVGGGFARYATDREWLVPHFEKMLYDNALLVGVLSEAYQVTKEEKYKIVIDDTLAFVERELLHENDTFYAALDADSEGIEGKFYVWDKQEIAMLLGDDAKVFGDFYDVHEQGNWEGVNILQAQQAEAAFAAAHSLELSALKALLQLGRKKLLEHRNKRIRPLLDDKIILGWNALMNIAYCKAYAATGNDAYKKMAIVNMESLLDIFDDGKEGLHHVWKNGQAKHPAFLDDYAYTIQALLQLQKVTGCVFYIQKAKQFATYVIQHFSTEDGYFYYTPQGQEDVIVRKKEVYDGATPSGNAIMAQCLLQLGVLLDEKNYLQQVEKMVAGLQQIMIKYPVSFGAWLSVLYQLVTGVKEIVLMGDVQGTLKTLLSHPVFHSIVMASSAPDSRFPLLKDKMVQQQPTFYLCENYQCQKPVHSLEELLMLLNDQQ